jgi:hypothetical protein
MGRTRVWASGAGGGDAAALQAVEIQRLSSEIRHNPVVAADVNPPPFSHADFAGFGQIHTKTLCFLMPYINHGSCIVRHFVSNHRKRLSMNDLQPKPPITQSSPIKASQACSSLIVPF